MSGDSSLLIAENESCDFLRHEVLALRKRVTQLEYLEESLQNSRKDLTDVKFALDQSSIVAITDRRGVITYVNDKFCEISQYSRAELLGKTHRIINSGYHAKAFFQEMWQTISCGEVWQGEVKNRAKDGTFYWVDTTIVPFLDRHGSPYQYVAIRNDITDLKQTREALQGLNEKLEARVEERTADLAKALHDLQQAQLHLVQNEKMSSLGQLVAGVAHEINNPVNFIYGNLSYAHEYIEDLLRLIQLYQQHYPNPLPQLAEEASRIDLTFLVQDLPKLLDSMRVGAERIQQIVASLRTFSRMDEAEMKDVNIHEGIDSTLMILQSRLKARSIREAGVDYYRPEIQVIKDYSNLPNVECYAGQLNQVFMNILSNAIDALEEKIQRHASRLANAALADTRIQTKSSEQLIPCITIRTRLTAPDRVLIEIADNGLGISQTVQKRLFDPFFSTKPIGKGTGLGLSISYQIVAERHGGTLCCQSEPGQSTLFCISIPTWQTSQHQKES